MLHFLADLTMLIHFAWILFVIIVFALTLRAFRRPRFFDRWIIRTIHLVGILYVGALEALGKYCPLTDLENYLRRTAEPGSDYPGSFIFHYIARLVYPDVSLTLLMIPTLTLALTTLIIFILRPPAQIKRLFTR